MAGPSLEEKRDQSPGRNRRASRRLARSAAALLLTVLAGLGVSCKAERSKSDTRAPTSADASAAVAAAPAPSQPLSRKALAPALTYKTPDGWRALTLPAHGPVVADFLTTGGPEQSPLRVQIQRRTDASGQTAAERVASAEALERAAFVDIQRAERKEYAVAGTRVVVLELEGVQKRLVPSAPGSSNIAYAERPAQLSLAAIVETEGVPYRVFVRGTKDGIDPLRQSFMDLVYSLRLQPAQ